MSRFSVGYLWSIRQYLIAAIAVVAICLHLAFRIAGDSKWVDSPLIAALLLGGIPLVAELLVKMFRGEFGSDLLAGISILTAAILGEYLAGTLVVLMLSGGEALEAFAVRSASSVLEALARRMPTVAHRKLDSTLKDVHLDDVIPGDVLVVLPHEICPIDGEVIDGHGVMDESYLTGEPYMMSKTPGSEVLSGAVNGESALTIRATKRAVDSRYAKIMTVMEATQQRRPRLRRLGDQLGAWYTPLALAIAAAAWMASGEPIRFLAVLVVATPCPLLIAIPVAIIGSISLAAKRGIVVKDPVALERISTCRTAIFDKTGTLTYGRPQLTEQLTTGVFDNKELLSLVGSVERYSKHPLSQAISEEVKKDQIVLRDVREISERPGEGLRGEVDGHTVWITSRKQFLAANPTAGNEVPPTIGGMECVLVVDDQYVGTYRFRDEPRREGAQFIHHLEPMHRFDRVLLVSGDRASEVEHLAKRVGITQVYASQSPEQKVAIVEQENAQANTMFVGDGINDAPALIAATVGVAVGQNSDVTAEAAGVVILDSSLEKVDEFMHISQRMRRIALQSAVGGMALSVVGMAFAAAGYLPPVAGAVAQEIIDVLAVLNALRISLPPQSLTDFQHGVR
ncbi:heavy metal translocating P-type ATPase [Aeoliella sp. ICT_H6.2]|uniref:P-type Zn(2+) transporter n=1 Tax=Aeoliella straminimaris TaxID=2954799 RepID=A0A9X2JI04_9BACT|nr:heavy metal translocating P-type ATPase [Aeoliella straminimaris]MCO6046361.1 heavy metal translocating P-type ATPase [Aeoliella straminimaris]